MLTISFPYVTFAKDGGKMDNSMVTNRKYSPVAMPQYIDITASCDICRWSALVEKVKKNKKDYDSTLARLAELHKQTNPNCEETINIRQEHKGE